MDKGDRWLGLSDAKLARRITDLLDERTLEKSFEIAFAYNVARFLQRDSDRFRFRGNQRAVAITILSERVDDSRR